MITTYLVTYRAVEDGHRKLVLADHTVTLLASQFENWCLLVTGDLSQQIQEKLLLDASWSHDRVVWGRLRAWDWVRNSESVLHSRGREGWARMWGSLRGCEEQRGNGVELENHRNEIRVWSLVSQLSVQYFIALLGDGQDPRAFGGKFLPIIHFFSIIIHFSNFPSQKIASPLLDQLGGNFYFEWKNKGGKPDKLLK